MGAKPNVAGARRRRSSSRLTTDMLSAFGACAHAIAAAARPARLMARHWRRRCQEALLQLATGAADDAVAEHALPGQHLPVAS
jgi:hypothetical protein